MFDDKQDTAEYETLSQEILALYDDFTQFHDQCSFLCDATASLATRHEALDGYSVQGLGQSTQWLKLNVREFQKRLAEIQIRASKL